MANQVSTKIQRQYISKGFEAFYFKDLSSKDEILKRTLKIINADDGIKGVIFVGLNKKHKPSLPQDYNLKLFKNEVFTLLSQIHPLPNYKAILQFVPSLYAKYGIIEIFPKLARFFFKHEVVQKSLLKFEDAEDMKIRKIVRAGDLNHEIRYEQALEHVSFHILNMGNLDDFHRLLSFLLHPTELGYIRDPIDMLAPIVNRVNLDDHNSVRETVANVKHLFLFFRKTKKKFQQTVHKAIKNLILGQKGNFELEIASHAELKKVISLFNKFDIKIDPEVVIEEIEKDKKTISLVNKQKSRRKNLWDNEILAKVHEILTPYISRSTVAPNSLFYVKNTQGKKSDQLLRLEKIDKVEPQVNENGRHSRNSKLSLYLKQYYDYECESCGIGQTNVTQITVSHRIPLYFGVDFGGVDKLYNMEVLCRFCHDKYEDKFDQDLFQNEDLITRKDVLQYLRSRFPNNKMLDV